MSTTDPGNNISEQAARWVIRMTESSEPLDSARRDEFNAWIADPKHAQEFIAISSIAAITADLPEADRDRWNQWARNATDVRTHSRRQLFRWALAASVAGVVALGGMYMTRTHWLGESYLTRTGETRVVTFGEGSVAYMNTRTELRWVGSSGDRRVELQAGEALFDVVHDETRPFRVMLDNSEIRVLGTRFNVYRKPDGDTVVTVLEGTVEVQGFNGGAKPEWVRRISANQQIEYRAIGLIREPHETDAQNAVRWRTGRYKFTNETIEHVLDELTRYSDQRIVISDPRIAERRITGMLNVRDVRDSLRYLQDFAPIDVKETNGTFTLEYRADNDQRKD
jgi:transmembrane sensor